MQSSPMDLDLSIFSPRPYKRLERRMYLLGCSCGRREGESRVPKLSRRQGDCFSYVVSMDGVHVCHPRDIVEYEDAEGEEEIDSDVRNVGGRESAAEVEVESEPGNLGEREDVGEGQVGSGSETLVEHESAGQDDSQSDPLDLAHARSTKVTTTEPNGERPPTLLQRRGRSLSRMRLVLSTSTQATRVGSSSHLSSSGSGSAKRRRRSTSASHEYIKQIGIDGEGIIHLMRRRNTRELIVRKTVSYARSLCAKPVEAAILQDIFPEPHRNIIRLHAFESYQAFDSDRADGARYYFEYCAGGDLHLLVDQYRHHDRLLPEPFIWHAYQQLASALEFLHRGFDPRRRSDPERRGVCHRDVKPSNCFLREGPPGAAYPDVVLADFGHATLDFATYDPAGTTIWQPPEMPRHSPKGDVYSLGAVIHFLIHFQAPIAELPDGARDTSSVREAWLSTPTARRPIMEFVDGYSEDLVCVMLVALETDEAKRKNARQLLRLVRDVQKRRVPPPGSGSPQQRRAQESPLANWAFDHMAFAKGGGEEGEEEGDEEGSGAEQYFEMMERFGLCVSRESSRVSSPAPSDGRQGSAEKSCRGCEMSSVSCLGETH